MRFRREPSSNDRSARSHDGWRVCNRCSANYYLSPFPVTTLLQFVKIFHVSTYIWTFFGVELDLYRKTIVEKTAIVLKSQKPLVRAVRFLSPWLTSVGQEKNSWIEEEERHSGSLHCPSPPPATKKVTHVPCQSSSDGKTFCSRVHFRGLLLTKKLGLSVLPSCNYYMFQSFIFILRSCTFSEANLQGFEVRRH
jgi:hypothetical protein